VHVPAAWLAMMCYMVMAISSLGTLVWRHPLADVAAKTAAPIGAAFTFLSLLTGSLWGRPMWGTWWVWDARLTSVFVLFLMYLGLMALHRAMDDPAKAARPAAVLTLVGTSTSRSSSSRSTGGTRCTSRPAVIRMDGPTIHPSMLYPLLVMAIAYTLIFFTLHLMAMRNEIWRRRVQTMRRQAAQSIGQGA
jgi:heme exporter protein C